MKNKIKPYFFSILLIVSFFASSFTNADKDKTLYRTDVKKSKITWTGRAEVGDYNLTGNINITEGNFVIENEQVKGGEFTIDMNSINCTNLTGMKKITLAEHLKGEDFFEVSKFPKSTFKITNVVAIVGTEQLFNVTGKLTIKGVTNNIIFPATIKKEGLGLSVKAILKVDRTKFNITYHSPSFFNNLKDEYIKNEFDLLLDIVGIQ